MGIPHLHVSCKCDVCLSLEKCDGNYVVWEVSSKLTVLPYTQHPKPIPVLYMYIYIIGRWYMYVHMYQSGVGTATRERETGPV